MSSDDLPIVVRLSKPSDHAFVVSSWLSSARVGPLAAAPKTIYYDGQRRKIECILAQSLVMMAILEPTKQEDEILLGYLVYQYKRDQLLLHYAFTKSPFRGYGIQHKLLENVNLPHFNLLLTSCPNNKRLLKHMVSKYQAIYDPYYFEWGSFE